MSTTPKIIDLSQSRAQRRKRYLAQHGDRLDSFIGEYVEAHMPFDFHDLTEFYINAMHDNQASHFCNLEFREAVCTAIEHCLGEGLWESIQQNRWFNRSYITYDEVIDRSASYFILRKGRVANS